MRFSRFMRFAFISVFLTAPWAYSQVNIEQVLAPGSFDDPVGIANANDGSGRFFIVEQKGLIRVVKNGAVLSTPFLDVTALTDEDGERGLLNVAFPPNYSTSGKFYIYYVDLNGDVVVNRCHVSGNPDVANSSCENPVMLKIEHPGHANHNGGGLAFGPDGFLYLSVGDGGGANDVPGNAQNKDILLGKMLRLDVSGSTGYAIPNSNPFVGPTAGLDEIWAYGLRNPWRFSFDRTTGDIFIGDVGQDCWEEVDFQVSNSSGGVNFGWRTKEANRCFGSCPGGTAGCDNTSQSPIFQYQHGTTTNNNSIVITGGYRYRGSKVQALSGKYVYADYSSGQIWSITKDGLGNWGSKTQIADTNYLISSFGEDESGELYFVDRGAGALYRFVGPGDPTFSDDFEDNTFTWNALNGTWSETGGKLTNAATKKSEVMTPAVFGGCGSPCTLETQVQTNLESSKISVIGWYANSKNYLELRMLPEKDKWVLKQYFNGSTVAKDKGVFPGLAAGVNYKVQITYDGTQFQVFIDDNATPLITMPDGASAFGIAGYRVKGMGSSASFAEINVN